MQQPFSPRAEPALPTDSPLQIEVIELDRMASAAADVSRFVARSCPQSINHDPRWLTVLGRGLRHTPFELVARRGGQIVGILPLSLLKSFLFGRYLVSLPYLNGGGVVADDDEAAARLIDRAIALADELDVRFLELRHETAMAHPSLSQPRSEKWHMRLALPATADELWTQLKAKVRNQIRKGERQEFQVVWGRMELLDDFYRVFSRNMRDLGTPVFGRALFEQMLVAFGEQSEICVLRDGAKPISAGILVHGNLVTEVPSASSLREYNTSNANMWMYWQLLVRTVERGQKVFDFGRSSLASNTFRFKEQWGAKPEPSVWQYFVRQGDADQMRPDQGRFRPLIQIWRRLPVPLTRVIGPTIVRGIP